MDPLTVKPAMAHYRKRDNTTHLVGEHLRSVGLLAAGFAGKLNIALAGELIGLLHDIGKYSQEFQDYIQSALGLVNCDEDDYVDADAQRGKVDHSSAGAQYIWRALSERGAGVPLCSSTCPLRGIASLRPD